MSFEIACSSPTSTCFNSTSPITSYVHHILIGSQALRTQHSAINIPIDFLRLVAVLPRLGHLQLEFADRRREFRVLFKLALLLRRLLLFPNRALARRGDLASGRQTGFGEALLLRQVLVLDESLVVVFAELLAEEVLHEADVVGQSLDTDGVVGWGCGEQDAVGGDGALVCSLVAAVEAVLEKV